MNILDELSCLRGQPISVYEGDELSIPCFETSDPDRLCKQPLVTVLMITYNHEPYIREAIEGVLAQKTDFEYELIIGEDCSQDRTREFCFDYQRLYPDKIRVLWANENVNKIGGNSRRCRARMRGEFLAYCEGDDRWQDSLKLQKQIDAFRKNPQVGLCFTDGYVVNERTSEKTLWNNRNVFSHGLIPGDQFSSGYLFGMQSRDGYFFPFILTASVMIRRTILEQNREDCISRWVLVLGDLSTWMLTALRSDVFHIAEPMVIYQPNSMGCVNQSRRNNRLSRDANVIRAYLAIRYFSGLMRFRRATILSYLNMFLRGHATCSRRVTMQHLSQLRHSANFGSVFTLYRTWYFPVLILLGLCNTDKYIRPVRNIIASVRSCWRR